MKIKLILKYMQKYYLQSILAWIDIPFLFSFHVVHLKCSNNIGKHRQQLLYACALYDIQGGHMRSAIKNRYRGLCNKKLSGFPFIEWQQSQTKSPHIRPQPEQVYLHVNSVGPSGNVNTNSI